MRLIRKSFLLIKEIGIFNITVYALYQVKRRLGMYSQSLVQPPDEEIMHAISHLSSNNFFAWSALSPAICDSTTLLENRFNLFGGEIHPLVLVPPITSLEHWTKYSNELGDADIKFTWEPARFTWCLELVRAFQATQDDKYASFFWKKIREFEITNPNDQGPNWVSAQEIAIRIINWFVAVNGICKAPSTTDENFKRLLAAIWQHAKRIPLTLDYAKAQNNNHVLSEALGLVLAGVLFKRSDSPAGHWQHDGEQEFEKGVLRQVADDGTYIQHSANYHRMMLQLALLYDAHLRRGGRKLPDEVREKLGMASLWLISQLDPFSGRVPNLGHNDGTLLLPFGCQEYLDYRPTAQAASLAFLGKTCLPSGKWDELAIWLKLEMGKTDERTFEISSPAVHKVGTPEAWGTLRGARFKRRPAHADQLHADLWWEGENIAMDAGTYQYNAPPPWQNALDATRVHNTVLVDGRNQMVRVGRFLWLDHAQAAWLNDPKPERITASHDGYQHRGVCHVRSLEYLPDPGFLVIDKLNICKSSRIDHTYTLQWLLPDWQWEYSDNVLKLSTSDRKMSVTVNAFMMGNQAISGSITLIRAGKTLLGCAHDEILGWSSKTYGEKHPALSFSFSCHSDQNLWLTTKWTLEHD